jgi:hypothetical protein
VGITYGCGNIWYNGKRGDEMLVRMKRTVFEVMEDRALVWACIEPTVSRIRGKDENVKSGVYMELTAGQQRLMLFQIFYGHARSAAEFYWFACDYLSDSALWEKMKAALTCYRCGSMVEVFGELENALALRMEQRRQPGGKEVTVMDLEHDRELLTEMTRLYELYRTAAGEALGLIAFHIRSCPEEYLLLEDNSSAAATS